MAGVNTLYATANTYSAFCNPVDTATPKRLHSVRGEKACKMLLVKGIKSSRTNNGTAAYLGYEATDGSQEMDVTAGAERYIYPPPGANMLIDPYDIFVDITTAGDGVWFNCLGIPGQ
jgi:hypothetical protein